jgi:pyridoxal biosynthesis lyase PdxS
MDRIDPIHVAPATQRQTEPDRFGRALRSAVAEVAGGLASTVALAAPFVPGGAVLAAAVRGGVRQLAGAAAGQARPCADGAPGDVLEATRALQQEAQSFNLQYLQLQENMQRDSREFTALTNIMKVKHDSARAAINNIH